jgi:hypothetical protein
MDAHGDLAAAPRGDVPEAGCARHANVDRVEYRAAPPPGRPPEGRPGRRRGGPHGRSPARPLCLRRRELLSAPGTVVTEVTLNHTFLMGSHNTDAERAPARVTWTFPSPTAPRTGPT